MNIFDKAYLNIINEWNSNLLLEANLKSLIPNIQKSILGNKSYQKLSDKEKEDLQITINDQLNNIENKVNEITDNKQYQSWIYEILKNKEVPITDLSPIKSALIDFIKLIKRLDLKPQQKNIQNYTTLKDLNQFIDSFKEEHKLQNNIYKNLKKVYSNQEFTVYFINNDQYEECNKLFGGNEIFNTGWCIAKNPMHFDNYITTYSDKFKGYFVFIKDNKPYALLHYGSYQFKNISDETLKEDNQNIIDCLLHISNNLSDYNYENTDLNYYGKLIFKQQHPNPTKEDFIAYEIGGEYNPKTKTIDCKGNSIRFKSQWLDENGTFDFNFINATDSWAFMFSNCSSLRKLPENFTIPKEVVNCEDMFQSCYNLEKLPDNFIIPNNVENCSFMFSYCEKLVKLPNNFIIPNGIKDCNYMFYTCKNLVELPNNFILPNSVTYCEGIFENCKKLEKLPNNFYIPNSVINCGQMFNNCKSLKELPQNFTIPESVKNCSMMFMKCESLKTLPITFTIPKNSNYDYIFNDSALNNRYNPKNLLR